MHGEKKNRIMGYLTEEKWMVQQSPGCIFVCSSLIIFRDSGRAESMTSLSMQAPLKQKEFGFRPHRISLLTHQPKNRFHLQGLTV